VNPIDILYPVFALAFWTFCVLLQVPIARFRAAFRREVKADDFKYGESAAVPAWVGLPNRNYMNLLELPVLFYAVCLIIQMQGMGTPTMVAVAWVYVALRVVHSLVHLTYNHVIHRLVVFSASNVVLLVLWWLAALKLYFPVGAS
jgi:hypothetical protein